MHNKSRIDSNKSQQTAYSISIIIIIGSRLG